VVGSSPVSHQKVWRLAVSESPSDGVTILTTRGVRADRVGVALSLHCRKADWGAARPPGEREAAAAQAAGDYRRMRLRLQTAPGP
jgi:hypothetical protein